MVILIWKTLTHRFFKGAIDFDVSQHREVVLKNVPRLVLWNYNILTS